jgi:hypothetical protein
MSFEFAPRLYLISIAASLAQMRTSETEIKSVNTYVLQRLEWSVRALAQPAHIQFGLFPDFVCVADELALDFDQWYQTFLDSAGDIPFSEVQIELLSQLDAKLLEMSGPTNETLWTDDALKGSAEWHDLREFALHVIEKLCWSDDPPPPNGDVFIKGAE